MTSVTLNEAREAIYQRWVTGNLTANYTFANEKYSPPTDTTWARVTVNHEAGEQDSLGSVGNRKFLRRARLFVQLYSTVDSGTRALDLLADQVRDLFEGVSFSGLYFVSVDIRESGTDGEWYQVVVDAPFFYQETK